MGKIKTAVKKYGKYALGAGAVGGLAYGATKLLKGRKGKVGTRRRGTSGLKTQVQRLALRIKKKQLQRKLFKEEMRI